MSVDSAPFTIVLIGNISSIHFRKRVEALLGLKADFHVIDIQTKSQSRLPSHADNKNVHFHIIDSKISSKIRYFLYFFRMKKRIKLLRPDIIHCYGAGLCGFLGLLLDIHPLIISVYGSEILRLKKKSLVNIIYAMLMRKILTNAELLTYASLEMGDFLREYFKFGSNKLSQLFWGFDPVTFHQVRWSTRDNLRRVMGIANDNIVFFSNRRMQQLYNTHRIVDSFKLVHAKFNKTKLILLRGIADNANVYFKKIKYASEELVRDGSIIFIDKTLSLKEMAELYNVSDFIISIPSSDELSATIWESMACGSMPILSDLYAYAEIKEKAKSIFVNCHDVIDIAKKMNQAVEDIHLIKDSYVNANRHFVLNTASNERVNMQLRRIYDNVISGSYLVNV